jgi:hypothetical protein
MICSIGADRVNVGCATPKKGLQLHFTKFFAEKRECGA